MLKNNYHTHVKYCNHAIGDVIDYVKEAVRLGFAEIGITDHAPIDENVMTNEEYIENYCHQNMKYETIKTYLNDIENARKEYQNRIKIYSGFETEFIPESIKLYEDLKSKCDYLNLGIHYFKDKTGKIINSYANINYNNVLEYADTAVLAMSTGLFNTLVHPDLFMYSYKNTSGKREFDDNAIKATRIICEAAIKYNIYLEVNANGIFNSIRDGRIEKWCYPYEDFWYIAREYENLKIIIGADAHRIEGLSGKYIDMAEEFCKKIGLKILDRMEINH
ncbi:MAG: PHP domain-containing protein [Anaeroplasma sp.]